MLEALEEGGTPPPFIRFPFRRRGSERALRAITMQRTMLDRLVKPTASAQRDKWKAAVSAQFNEYVRGEKVYDDCDFKRVEDRRNGHAPFDHEVWALGIRFNPQ
jgi:hypothetical protein